MQEHDDKHGLDPAVVERDKRITNEMEAMLVDALADLDTLFAEVETDESNAEVESRPPSKIRRLGSRVLRFFTDRDDTLTVRWDKQSWTFRIISERGPEDAIPDSPEELIRG